MQELSHSFMFFCAGDSTGQGPSNVLENNYGAIFGISVGALVVTIVMCMSIIFILDRVFRVISKEDRQEGLSPADSGQDKTGSLRFVRQHVQGIQIAAVQEEEGNASTSAPHHNLTSVASGSRHLATGINIFSGIRHHSSSALSASHDSTNVIVNYKRHSSASAIISGNRHYSGGVPSDSHCCTTIAEVHQNPTFENTAL